MPQLGRVKFENGAEGSESSGEKAATSCWGRGGSSFLPFEDCFETDFRVGQECVGNKHTVVCVVKHLGLCYDFGLLKC